MYIAIDLIIVVIIASVIIGAVKRGFIRSVFRLGSTVASIVIAILFYKELSAYFCETFVYEKTAEYIGGFLENITADINAATDFSAIAAALPEQLHSTAELLGFNIEDVLEKYIGTESLLSADTLGESLSLSAATVVSNVLAFAALFFGSLIVLGLVCFILDKLAKLPILNGTNRFLGFLFGVLEGLILGIVLSKVAEALCSAYGALNPDFTFTDVANGTYVAKFFIDICPW